MAKKPRPRSKKGAKTAKRPSRTRKSTTKAAVRSTRRVTGTKAAGRLAQRLATRRSASKPTNGPWLGLNVPGADFQTALVASGVEVGYTGELPAIMSQKPPVARLVLRSDATGALAVARVRVIGNRLTLTSAWRVDSSYRLSGGIQGRGVVVLKEPNLPPRAAYIVARLK
jgi:hypothetical protein